MITVSSIIHMLHALRTEQARGESEWLRFVRRLGNLDEHLHIHAGWLDRFRLRVKLCGWIWQESSIWSFWLCYARNPVVTSTLRLKDSHEADWREEREAYWLWRLFGEFIELALSLVGLHGHTPDMNLGRSRQSA